MAPKAGDRHCEERSDEAIQGREERSARFSGLLRFARNDGVAESYAAFSRYEMPDRGVGRRDMIEPVRHFRLRAASDDIGHRAARDQPHHELDAFRSRLADIFDVRHLREALGVVDQPVEEVVIPLLVDEAGARSLKLMAHAAGAPDMDVDILGVAHDRSADRLPKRETTRPGRHGVLHDVDRERNDLARPFLDLAKHAAQRHGEAVVDVDLVDHGEVEILLDHLRGDMGRKLRIADDLRHRARAVAFVGGIEFRPGHDRESGDHLEAEGGGVIVINDEDHVGLVGLHPLLVEVVAGENRLPVIFLGFAKVEGGADGGDVRSVKRGGDAGHVQASFGGEAAMTVISSRGAGRLRPRRACGCPRSSGRP